MESIAEVSIKKEASRMMRLRADRSRYNRTFVFALSFLFFFLFSIFYSFPLDIKWKVQTSQTSNPPALSSDYLFSVSDYGNVVALNRLTGARIWDLSLETNVLYRPFFKGNVLFVPAEKTLFAISKDGRIIGNITFNSTISSPVSEIGSNLFITTREGMVYIFSQPQNTFSSRNIIKTFNLGGETDSSFVVSGNKIYISTVNGKIYSVDPSGSSVMLYDLGYSVWRSRLAIVNNSIYIPAEHSIYAVDLQGKLMLAKRISDGNLNSISTDGQFLYIGSDDGYLYSVDFEGNIVWKFRTNNSVKSIPLVMPASIIISSRDKNIYSISKNGELIWNLSLSDWPSQIVEDNGVLYTTTYDGTIHAISTLSCRITNPESNSTILPIVAVAGDAYSEYGVKEVQISTLPGQWQSVSLHGEGRNVSWSGNIQITGFSEGPVSLQCRVIDNSNNEEQSPYYRLDYNFVFSDEKLPRMNISYQSQVNVNQPLTLMFFNEEGTILTDVTVKIGGEIFKVTDKSGKFVYTPKSEGKLIVYVEKQGYKPTQLEINVTKPLIQPIYILIIFIVAVAVVIYSSIKKGTWK